MTDVLAPGVHVRALAGVADLETCARLMAASEPWLTLRRDAAASRTVLADASKEVHLACETASGAIAGFVILDMRGLLRGYLQTICVAPAFRGCGLGTRFMRWAEERIFRESPNVFLCVSSFNTGARALYERLGYEHVGVLRGYLVDEHDELLMRKSRGSWRTFAAGETPPPPPK